jgi:hypothetical protein
LALNFRYDRIVYDKVSRKDKDRYYGIWIGIMYHSHYSLNS